VICQCCGSDKIESVDGNYYSGDRIRYICHPGYGGQIVSCGDCGFMFVEYIHPRTVEVFYGLRGKNHDGGVGPGRRQIDSIVCRGQREIWGAEFPTALTRALFFSAGRAMHGHLYLKNVAEVHVCELFPSIRDEMDGQLQVAALGAGALAGSDLAGTYDLIILSNVFERLPFPRYWLSWCSNLLKSDGLLAIEMPKMDSRLVSERNFSDEEVNFFTPETLGRLISIEGSFGTANSQLGNRPDGRNTIRVLLTNERRKSEPPEYDVDAQELLTILGKLSFACFNHAVKVAKKEGQPECASN